MTCQDQASQWISKNEILSEHRNQRWHEGGNLAISQILKNVMMELCVESLVMPIAYTQKYVSNKHLRKLFQPEI